MTLIGVTFPDQEPAAEQPAKKAPSKGNLFAGGLLVVLLLACCIGGVVKAMAGGGSNDSSSSDRTLEAKSMCETFVKRQLKAPATAKFSDESAAKVSATEYTSGGSVDSENSFGALLRSTYVCDMTYDASKQEWTAKSVSVK